MKRKKELTPEELQKITLEMKQTAKDMITHIFSGYRELINSPDIPEEFKKYLQAQIDNTNLNDFN
jgi:hypothetical protein